MYQNRIGSIIALYSTLFSVCTAQNVVQIDTLWSDPAHFANTYTLSIPEGVTYLQASSTCGFAIAKVAATDTTRQLDIEEKLQSNSHLLRRLRLGEVNSNQGMKKKSILPTFRQNLSASITNVGNTSRVHQASISLDPAILTDMSLDLGTGRAVLNLSDMSLSSVNIRSAMADVVVYYHSPNPQQMEKMNVHAIKADLTLKYPEYARAELIDIQNDVGNTEVILGNSYVPEKNSHIVVHSGAGTCSILVHPQHPVKIYLRKGIFSSANISANFYKLSDEVYVNDAYKKAPEKATIVNCHLDFGDLKVKSHQ